MSYVVSSSHEHNGSCSETTFLRKIREREKRVSCSEEMIAFGFSLTHLVLFTNEEFLSLAD